MKTYPLLALGLFLVGVLTFTTAEAQKIKVKKIKGKTALIESSVPLEEGQVYDLATEPLSQSVDYKSAGFKSRNHSLSIGGSLYTLKGDNYQRNFVSIQGRYGWNFTGVEFGGVAQFTTDDVGNGATQDVSGGGYFDYNFVANHDSKSLIYGAVGLVTFGSRSTPTTLGTTNATTIDLNVGGFISWFINASNSALRLEAFFDNQNINTSAKQTNAIGFGSRILLVSYF